MPNDDLALVTATELVQLFRARKASPVDAIRSVFDRISRYNGIINAFCLLDEEAGLSAARASEERWRRDEPAGLVDGVPTSVKDLSFTRGWPTLRASRAIPKEGPWDEDSPSVARMRDHGAVIFGKTTVPEFATRVITHSQMCGITRNPWNPAKTPGGSSGGAAASIAAGMGTIALASDAAGSIRVPAAFTGLFGLKPTFGLVPDYPSSYLGTLAVIGPITRSVEDAALTMTVISEPDARDSYALPYTGEDFRRVLDLGVKGLKVAYSPTLGFAKIDPEIASIVGRATQTFAELGADVEMVERVCDSPTNMLYILLLAGLANAFRQFGFTEADRRKMEPNVVAAAEEGGNIPLLEYLAARREREKLGAKLRDFHQNYDLLLAPVSAIPPFETGVEAPTEERYARLGDWGIALNAAANLTKQPAASVPCGFTSEGLPVGLQVIGPIYGDALVLRACRAFERVHPVRLPDMAKLPHRVSQEVP
jgi:aspartyl-tRNA(Asn)/glutamyl-tRNA(Gln) amidotransferase subunit A